LKALLGLFGGSAVVSEASATNAEQPPENNNADTSEKIPDIPLVVAPVLPTLRGFDPRSVVEKKAVERGECKPKDGVEFMSQYMEDETVFNNFYSSPIKCGGTVVEIGGFDGKTFSNSWYFEYALGWQALLVEALPRNYEKMLQNRPDAINIFGAACLGETVDFTEGTHDAVGGLTSSLTKKHNALFTNEETGVTKVPCMTMAHIFRRHHINHIDVLFLDVEGSELTTLQTIDWPAVEIDVIVVQMDRTNEVKDEAVRAVLRAQGYVYPFEFATHCKTHKDECMNNEVFIRRGSAIFLQQWERGLENGKK